MDRVGLIGEGVGQLAAGVATEQFGPVPARGFSQFAPRYSPNCSK